MSKRIKGNRGKKGRTIRNPQYCREHGRVLAKRMYADKQREATQVKPTIKDFFG